jgi:hypothetical protein
VAYIRFSDVQSIHWQEIVRLRQSGKITVAWDADTGPLFDDETFLDTMLRNSGVAADAVATTAALRGILQADRTNRQIRLVQAENSLYRFETGAVAGGETPSDVDDGRWYEIGSAVNDWGIVGEMASVAPGTAAAAGTTFKVARIDHSHAVATGVVGEVVSLTPATTNAAGSILKVALVDHAHAVATGVVGELIAVAPDTAAAAGTTDKFARIDHAHSLATGLVGELIAVAPDTVAAAGTTSKVARVDHAHALATGVVGEMIAIAPDTAAAAGTTNKVARIDHVHGVATGLVGEVAAVGSAAAAGTTSKLARIDHVHALALTKEMVAVADAGTAFVPIVKGYICTPGGGATGAIFNANCPMKLKLVDVAVRCLAVSGGGTIQLYDGDPGAGGAPITNAIACATDEAITRAGSIASNDTIAVNGSLWYSKNAAADGGVVMMTFMHTT